MDRPVRVYRILGHPLESDFLLFPFLFLFPDDLPTEGHGYQYL